MDSKQKLILDVQNLLNTYSNTQKTVINPDLFQYMDEKTIIDIITDLLAQKEDVKEADLEWLEKFKKTLN